MSQAPSILFIDDDMQVRMLARDLLRQEFPDAPIRMVDSLDSLRQALEAGGFDIAITDYQLGWTDGLAVLREVKSRYPDCPVVMFTGTGSEEIAVEAMRAGLDDYVLKSSSEHVARLSASVRGVLARAEERRAARDTEARYRSLVNDVLDTSAVGLFILDAAFKVVWINKAVERYFGLRRTDVIGRHKRRLIRDRIKQFFDQPEEFAARILQSYERNSCELGFECHMPAADGREERWLEHRSLPIRTGLYAGGRIEHYYDITERKRMETTLAEREEYLRLFIEHSPVALAMFDRDMRYLAVSRHWMRDYKLGDELLIGRSHYEVFPEIPQRWREVHQRCLAGATERCEEDAFVRSDGRTDWLRWEILPWHKTDGAIGGIVIFTEDITVRKQAEEALKNSERQFREVTTNIHEVFWITDPAKKRMVYVSPAYEDIWGRPCASLYASPRSWLDAIHSDDRARVLESAVTRQVTGQYHETYRIIRPDDTVRWIEDRAFPIRNEHGDVDRVVGVAQDITARKEAEDDLRRANETLSKIIRSSPLAIMIVNTENRVTLWNPAAEQMFGWTEAEIIGQPLPTIPSEKQEEHRVLQEQVLKGQTFVGLEIVRQKKNGAPIHLSVSTASLRDADGRLTGVLVIMADITERKQLETLHSQLAAIVECSHAPMISLTLDGVITTWNKAAERLYGYTAGEAIGKPMSILLPPGDPHEWARLVERVQQEGTLSEHETVRMTKDGRRVEVSITVSMIKDGQGRPVGIAKTVRDITARKQTEVQARRLEHMSLLGQLLGGIAHEIKNPLFVVSGHMELMKDRLAKGEYGDLQKDMDRIDEATKRMVQTVQRFLTLARPSSPIMKPCLVQELLQQTLDFLAHELLTHQITLETDISPRLPAIQGDPRLLQDAFLNLLMNAIQAMHGAHGRGRLLVTAMFDQRPAPSQAQPGHSMAPSENDAWIEIRVEDDGPGIVPEHRARLFEPFFTTKPEGAGTGLGLWTVRSNVAALGGTVSCDTQVGQGTTFIVRLPLGGVQPATP